MVARGPGAVGCAHCTKLGAVVACAVCKHLVCDACAADWSTCDEPSGRMFQLGRGRTLIDVDPGGRFGLVEHWPRQAALVDLRALRWIDEPNLPVLRAGDITPRLTAGNRLIYADVRVVDAPYTSLVMSSLPVIGKLELSDLPNPVRCTGVSLVGDRYFYVTDTEQIAVVSPRPADPILLGQFPSTAMFMTVTFEPLPKKVVQAAHVDGARDLLATGTWGEITLHRIVDSKLVLVGHVPTTGDTVWVAVAGACLAAIVKGGAQRGLTVWRLGSDDSIRDVALHLDRKVHAAALSRDGRFLAAAVEHDDIVVHDLVDGSSVTFDEHTDDVTLVRFAGPDQLLVTADKDHRVVVRPRSPSGYARVVMPATLADA